MTISIAPTNRLTSLLRLLNDVSVPFNESTLHPTARWALGNGLALGIETLKSIAVLAAHGLHIHTLTVARPYYERAAYLRWASLVDDGWDRFALHDERTLEKWFASMAKRLPAQFSKYQAEAAAKIHKLENAMVRGMPSVADCISAVVKMERDAKARPISALDGADEHTTIYSTLCKPAHGDSRVAGAFEPADAERFATGAALFATRYWLLAFGAAANKEVTLWVDQLRHESATGPSAPARSAP